MAAGLPADRREVAFTVSAGAGVLNPTPPKVFADQGNRATVELTSPQIVTTGRVTGVVDKVSSSATISFVRLFVLGYFVYYMPYKERIETARLESRYGDAFRRFSLAVPSLLPRLHAYVPLAADGASPPQFSVRFRDNHELATAVTVLAVVLLLAGRWALL